MDEQELQLLKQINNSLAEINNRQRLAEVTSDTVKLLDKSDTRVQHALNQIQGTFDRIHDKVFNFNNVMIGAFLVLGTFPSNTPYVELWTIIFPITLMAFMIYIDYRQMEVHRFASTEQEWTSIERDEYGKKINAQTLLSLLSLFLSICCLLYLVISVLRV